MKENSYFVNKNTPSKISLSYCGGEVGGSRRTLVRSSDYYVPWLSGVILVRKRT